MVKHGGWEARPAAGELSESGILTGSMVLEKQL